MPWRSKSLAFLLVSELASCRQEGNPGYKNSAPTPTLWCDVLMSGLVQAGETAGLNIAGPAASLCQLVRFWSCLCCIGVRSDPHYCEQADVKRLIDWLINSRGGHIVRPIFMHDTQKTTFRLHLCFSGLMFAGANFWPLFSPKNPNFGVLQCISNLRLIRVAREYLLTDCRHLCLEFRLSWPLSHIFAKTPQVLDCPLNFAVSSTAFTLGNVDYGCAYRYTHSF